MATSNDTSNGENTTCVNQRYIQGSSINWMMMKFMGDDTFAKGLAQYIDDFQYGNAAMVDLFNSLNKVSRKCYHAAVLKNNVHTVL